MYGITCAGTEVTVKHKLTGLMTTITLGWDTTAVEQNYSVKRACLVQVGGLGHLLCAGLLGASNQRMVAPPLTNYEGVAAIRDAEGSAANSAAAPAKRARMALAPPPPSSSASVSARSSCGRCSLAAAPAENVDMQGADVHDCEQGVAPPGGAEEVDIADVIGADDSPHPAAGATTPGGADESADILEGDEVLGRTSREFMSRGTSTGRCFRPQ